MEKMTIEQTDVREKIRIRSVTSLTKRTRERNVEDAQPQYLQELEASGNCDTACSDSCSQSCGSTGSCQASCGGCVEASCSKGD